MTVQFPMMRLKLPGGGGMSVTPYPTLKFSLLVPQALKLQFLPAIPGSNIHGKVNRSGDTMGGSLILDHDPLIPLEAATKQYVDFVGSSGVTPGDKGDITVGGGGTWTIDNDAVTYAKMQNISAAGRLLGRGSAGGAGDPEEIILGTNLTMSGTTLNASGGGGGGSGDVVGPAPATDNAIVRFDGTTGKLIQNSNVIIADTGATLFTHTGSFRGLDQQQTLPLTGTAPDHDSGYDGHNVFRITQDALTMIGPLGHAKGWTYTYEWGGANATAGSINTGRTAMAVTVYQTGATTKVPGYQSSVSTAAQIAAITTVSSGGTGFGADASGNVVGANIIVGLNGSATFYRGLLGLEIDVGTATGCSADDRNGLFIAGGGLPGNSDIDCAIGIHGAPNPDTPAGLHGWKTAILLYDPLDLGHGSITPTGYVMRAINQDTNTIGHGIDLSGFGTITGNAWKSQGAQIDGTGAFVFTSPNTNSIITTNTTPLAIGTTGAGNTAPILDNATAGRAVVWVYSDAGAPKWYVGKATDNSFGWLDASTLHTVLSSALGSDAVRLGTVGTNGGKLLFSGASGGTVGVQVASGAGTWDLTLPTTGGTAGYFLQTNGSGVSTWAAAPGAGAGSPGGATTHVQFNTAGVFDGDDEFTYDSAGGITLGKTTGGSGTIKLKGSTSGTVTVEPAPAAGTWTLRLPVDDGDAGEVLTTNGSGVTSWEAAAAGREVVTVARTYYVDNVTGSDADDGLTTGNAFATIGKAINVVCDDIYWVNASPEIRIVKTGVNYDEQLLLRPWFGFADIYNNMAYITGDSTDPTHGTGVLIKPTSAAVTAQAAVHASGEGARWWCQYISVDGSSSGTYQDCYRSMNGAYLGIMSGDLGPATSGSQLFAIDGGVIFWGGDGVHDSHIYGGGTLTTANFLFLLNNSTIIINPPIVFDADPGYITVVVCEQNSYFEYYHNVSFSGVHPTGARLFLRENSRGNTHLPLADIPGDTWSTNYIDTTSTFNSHGPTRLHTYATLPTKALLPGSILTITDSNTQTPGAAVASGGGAFTVPLWYTGSGWVVLAPVTGSVSDGDKGDVVVSGSGATWTIDSDVVSYAKMQNVSAASKLLGRGASGAGDPEEITLGTGLSMSGTTLNSSGGSASLTIGSSTITSGTTKRVLYDLAGVLQEATAFTIESNQPNVITGQSYLYAGSPVLNADPSKLNSWLGGAGNLSATGTGNHGAGFQALFSLTTGNSNLAAGQSALFNTTTGSANVAIGSSALGANTTGQQNVALGGSALQSATTADFNMAIGAAALFATTTGAGNTGIGNRALFANTVGANNVGIGYNAVEQNIDGGYNTGVGFAAMRANVHGNYNVAIGVNAMAFGAGADGAVGIGLNALIYNAGAYNVGIGYQSGDAVTTGTNNTIIGVNSGRSITTGSSNTVIGHDSTLGVTTGSNNTVIGGAVTGLATGLANNVILADGAGNIRLRHDGVDVMALAHSLELTEMTAPAAPAANKGRLYMQDNGGGKTQLCVLFPSGAAQVIATEP